MTMKKLIHVKQIAQMLKEVVDNNAVSGQTGYDAHDGLTIDFDGVFGHFDGVRANLEGLITAEETARTNADTSLQSGLSAEIGRATGAEGVLTSDLAQEILDRIAGDAAERLFASNARGVNETARDASIAADKIIADDAIAAELTARTDAEAAIQTALDAQEAKQESDRAAMDASYKAADSTLTSNLATQVAKQAGDEADIEAKMAAEISRATAAEGVNTTAISTEVTNRTTADSALQAQITNIISNVDPAALDSLTEIVLAFEAEDVNLNGAITILAATHTSELAALALDVDNNEQDGVDDRALIRSEIATAKVTDDAALAAEAVTARAAEVANATAISDEEIRALAAEGVLTSGLATEILDRISGDASTLASAKVYTDAAKVDAIASAEAKDVARAAASQAYADQAEADAVAAIINSEGTYSDLFLVGEELRAIAANAGGSGRAMNFYKEESVTNVHVSNSPQNVSMEMIFGLPGSVVNHSNGNDKKMNMQEDQAYSSFFVTKGGASSVDLSKCQIFLNGVLLQSGKPGDLAANDFEFEYANLQGNPVQIKFSQGLLEEGDKLQVYMSFA